MVGAISSTKVAIINASEARQGCEASKTHRRYSVALNYSSELSKEYKILSDSSKCLGLDLKRN